MYRIFYAEKNTTLNERFPEQNAGIDQILEFTKHVSGTIVDGRYRSQTFNTRILIDFGSEIDSVTTAVNDGKIPPLGNAATSASVYLSLRSSDATDLIQKYNLEAFPVSQSWSHGQGYVSDNPKTTKGASWYYRNSKDLATNWTTGSAASRNVSSGTTETRGGGTWMTGSTYEASQSFSYESTDVNMNITTLIDNWLGSPSTTTKLENHGLLLKFSGSQETESKPWLCSLMRGIFPSLSCTTLSGAHLPNPGFDEKWSFNYSPKQIAQHQCAQNYPRLFIRQVCFCSRLFAK